VDLAFAGDLHVVAFDGIQCTRATVASGAYPALTELGYVTRGAPKGRVARFIRWVRSSRKARRVIATRYVPVQATRAS
jgi:ABC-type phosphate transport system substrate-binding protein